MNKGNESTNFRNLTYWDDANLVEHVPEVTTVIPAE